MKVVNRSLAIDFFVFSLMMGLDEASIKNILCADYYDNNGVSIEYENIFEENVQYFLIGYLKDYECLGISNEYLEGFLQGIFKVDISIVGDEELLEPCPCCKYRTLEERGDYDICPVCFWEDDGSRSLNEHSYANAMIEHWRKTVESNEIPYE